MGFTWNPANLTATTKRLAIERFWKCVNKTDGCWLWTGPVGSDGYGRIRPGTGTKKVRVHRFSYELHYGPIPEGKQVLHKCDTPLCVKPADLFLGTNQNNIDDMVSKGRQGKGSSIRQAKLTDQKVHEIRTGYAVCVSNSAIADKYGVKKETVRRIRAGITWKHVPLEPPKEKG